MMKKTAPLLAALAMGIMMSAGVFSPFPLTGQKAMAETAARNSGKKANRKVDITADKMEIFDDKNQAVFTGNVKAVRGDTTLYTSRMEVDFKKVRQADGTEKTEATFLRAFNGVRIVQPKRVITGNSMRMDIDKELVWVNGNVVVKEGDSVIRGDRLFHNLKTDVSRVESSGKKRVRGIFSTK